MTDPKWQGKIYLKSGGAPITVEVNAFNSFQVKKAIEAMYGTNFKSWYMQPYQVK